MNTDDINHKAGAGENDEETTNIPVNDEVIAEEVSNEQAASAEESELKELNDKYLRLYADFENYKRRTNQERLELSRTAGQEVIVSLLPVLDDFERALKAMQDTNEMDAVKEGIQLVYNKLKNTLEQKGLKPIQSIGTAFNIDFHEAITSIPAPSPDLKGKVVDEIEKGYTLKDKVVRFAKVVVGE